MMNTYTNSKIKSYINNLSKSLGIGNSGYYTCPVCSGDKKLGITSTFDGTIYQCFRNSCGLRGRIANNLDKDQIEYILNNKATKHVKEFEVPDYFINGFASEASIKFAIKYNLLKTYNDELYKTSYDPKLNRQVFFHYDDTHEIVGAMGRALEYRQIPKAYIYPNSIKTPWFVGHSTTGVIVEDILSAVQVANTGRTGIALSGTSLQLDYLGWFKNFNTIIICLDKDASTKSLQLKKLLDLFVKDVIIVLIEKDIKDMSLTEVEEKLS